MILPDSRMKLIRVMMHEIMNSIAPADVFSLLEPVIAVNPQNRELFLEVIQNRMPDMENESQKVRLRKVAAKIKSLY